MSVKKSFGQQRIEALTAWAATTSIPGIDQATYVDVFDYVLGEQAAGGYWQMPGTEWNVVMTAVLLKALAALRFRPADRWLTKGGAEGGIDQAVRHLTEEVKDKEGKPAAVGEDIWDACQVALALAEFQLSPAAKEMVDYINDDWVNLYQSACKAAHKNRWCGPAYLAAMLDVMGRYNETLGKDSRFDDAINQLKKLEDLDAEGNTRGFRATAPRSDIDFWSSCLVLRTLCSVPPGRQDLVDREQVQRVTSWLLGHVKDDAWQQDPGEAPMFCARGLHALRAARAWVNSETREQIDRVIEWGNGRLVDFFRHQPSRLGTLKAYTAVVEYLADWTVPVPAGLLFHARRGLNVSSIARTEPQPRPDGIRITWLSDLHVAAESKKVPAVFSPLKQVAGKFMRLKGTPLTQHFQLRNVQTILDHVKEQKPDHILLSGDLTNYAQESQFRSLHDQLLAVQAAMLSDSGSAVQAPVAGELDPNLWTILPGNHDVTNEQAADDPVRQNLGMFFHWFGKTYVPSPETTGYDKAFPLRKILKGRDGAMSIRLVGLDSTVPAPVWRVGVNARGRIDQGQLGRLNAILNERNDSMTLVALHHHPIVVPELNPEIQDYFLSLKEVDGRELIKLCVNSRVSAILHGHFHRFSSWSGLTPSGRHMAIIGSPAGTLDVPGLAEEYLELREADRETPAGVEQGLALYTHRHESGEWVQRYTGIFLPCP